MCVVFKVIKFAYGLRVFDFLLSDLKWGRNLLDHFKNKEVTSYYFLVKIILSPVFVVIEFLKFMGVFNFLFDELKQGRNFLLKV